MSNEEIIEGNKLIATYFGKGIVSTHGVDLEYYGTEHYPMNQIKFHTSWDWLMPVLEKICRTKVGDGIKYIDHAYPRTFGMTNKELLDNDNMMVRLNGGPLFDAPTLIEATYMAVVQFIKEHKQ